MTSLRRPTGLLLVTLPAALALAACGPSAQVLTTPIPLEQPSSGLIAGPPTPIPLDGPTSSLAPAGSPVAGAAYQVVDFPAENAFEVTDVTWAGSQYVAVGFGGLDGAGYDGVRQGLVWTSPDGLSWQQMVDPAFADVTPYFVLALGSDVYAIGELSACDQFALDPCADSPDAGTAVLRSANGGPWQLLPQPDQIKNATFDDVVVAQGLLAAVGSADDELQTSTLWLSDDGSSWIPTSDLGGLDPIDALTATEQRFVAFGTRYVDATDEVQLIGATATDGIHFSPTEASNLPTGDIDGMVADPSGVVAVGYSEDDQGLSLGIALQSPDGLSWNQATADDGSFAGGLLTEVFVTPSGYVTAGYVPDVDDYSIQVGWLWASADGLSWRSLGQIGDQFTLYGASTVGPSGLLYFAADQEDTSDSEELASTISAWFVPVDRLSP